ncbi:MAG: tRNA (adenosine(37)-N6)-threonylcarbamoyltransferase complex ATPase subunit type 1 TsaE [Clostridia bacterium]|nr:tRNA (adenosine(37)-N6)-threonylcarbamoyltransferase complex ATPase subunit type 1 TsaE [Clostridia bacterium]
METLTLYGLSEASMEALGHALGQRLFPGAFLAFFGDLGAGKTAFVAGLCAGLGVRATVSSPTFAIV